MKSILGFSQLLSSGPRGALSQPDSCKASEASRQTKGSCLLKTHLKTEDQEQECLRKCPRSHWHSSPLHSTTGTQGVEEGEWRAPP